MISFLIFVVCMVVYCRVLDRNKVVRRKKDDEPPTFI